MKEFQIDTSQRQAAFIAQLAVESESLNRLNERYTTRPNFQLPGVTRPPYTASDQQDYFNYWYGGRNGNVNDNDGYTFRGRGYIQLTGRSNYEAADKALGLEGRLIANPDLAADPALAARLAGWFWQQNRLSDFADQLDIASRDFSRSVNAISRGVNRGDTMAKRPANDEGRRGAGTVRALQAIQSPRNSHTGLYDEVAQRLRNSLGLVLGSSTREDLMNRILQTSPAESFGGVVLGNQPLAPATIRSAKLYYNPTSIQLGVEVKGREEIFYSDEFSPTELWCAYQFLHPDADRQRLGAREKDFGLVGILNNNVKAEGSWEFSLHPAVANTILAYDAMRMDMALSIEDPRLPRIPTGWTTYRWHDERAIIWLENGKIQTRPASGPSAHLLRCELWDKTKELPVDLDPLISELYRRHDSLQAIDHFARLLAIFNWIDRDGLLYAMPDNIQPVRINQPNKFYHADMAYEGLTIVRDTLGADDSRDRDLKDSPCKVHDFALEPGRRYIVEAISNFDAFLRIEDSAGRTIVVDDDSAGNLDPRILFRPTVRDDYRFIVTTTNPKHAGYYTLRIWEGDIGPGQTIFERFGTLRQDHPRDAVLTSSPCQVLFPSLDERMSYVVQLRSKDFEPFLRVEDVNRKQLAYDSGSRDRNARLVFTPPATGAYRIVVTTSNIATGSYTLTIERSNEPIRGDSVKSPLGRVAQPASTSERRGGP